MLRYLLKRCLVFGALPLFAAEPAAPLAVPATQAPRLERIEPGQAVSMGVWDDVYACPHADVLLLRRGPEIYSFSLGASPGETLVMRDSRFENARFYEAVSTKERLWIFLERKREERIVVHKGGKNGGDRLELVREGPGGAPLALELCTKKLVEFVPTGVKMLEDQGVGVINAAPEHGGALVRVYGADPANWPEKTWADHIVFWLDLCTGKTVQLPVGWSPYYYSADLKWAVWQRGSRSPPWRLLMGVNMATGEVLKSGFPDWEKDFWVSSANVNKPLSYEAAPLFRTNSLDTHSVLVGVAARGQVFPWKFVVDRPVGPTAKAADGWAALYVQGHDEQRPHTRSLWFAPLESGVEPRRLSDQVRDYEVLSAGRCLFTATSSDPNDPKRDFFSAPLEVYVYEDQKKAAWNLLDGVEQLPPLSPEVAGKPYVDERTSVRLLRSFGDPSRGTLVVASFDQIRGDRRGIFPLSDEPRVPRTRWQKKILVTSQGRRLVLDLPDRESEQVWLHNSGTLIRAIPNILEAESGRLRRLDLSLLPFAVPQPPLKQ